MNTTYEVEVFSNQGETGCEIKEEKVGQKCWWERFTKIMNYDKQIAFMQIYEVNWTSSYLKNSQITKFIMKYTINIWHL